MKIIHFISCIMLLGSAFASEPSKREKLSRWVKQKKEDIKTTKIDLKSGFISDPSRHYFYELAVAFRKSKSQKISPEKPSSYRDYYDSFHLPDDINALFEGATDFAGKNCRLTGQIPANLFELNSLITVDLSENTFSGDIPANLGNLNQLKSLNLSRNKLTGSLPDSVDSLINLENLNVSGNQLSGPLPESIGGLVSLENLNVSGNQLSGPLPDSIGDLISLENLNLANNQLSGDFSLARHAPSAKVINLENNLFTHIDLRTSQTQRDGNVNSSVIPKIALFGNPIQDFQCDESSEKFQLVPDAAGTHIHIDTSLLQDEESTRRILGAFLQNPTNTFPFQIGFYTKSGSSIPDFLKNKGFQGDEIITLDLHHRDDVVLDNFDETQAFDETQTKGIKSYILVSYRNTKNQPDPKFKDFLQNQLQSLQSPTYDMQLLTEVFPGYTVSQYNEIRSIIRAQPFDLRGEGIQDTFKAAERLQFPIDIEIKMRQPNDVITFGNLSARPREAALFIMDPSLVRTVRVFNEEMISPLLGEIFANMDHNYDQDDVFSLRPKNVMDSNGVAYEDTVEAEVDSVFQKFPQLKNAPVKTFRPNRDLGPDLLQYAGGKLPSGKNLYRYVLKRMPDLEQLNFQNYRLGAESIERFAPYLVQMKNLVSLNLSGCELFITYWRGLSYQSNPTEIPASLEIIRSITSCLGQLTNLEELNLSNNKLTDQQLEELAFAFRQMTHLKKLDLSSNKFTSKAQTIMKDVLANNTKLQCTL